MRMKKVLLTLVALVSLLTSVTAQRKIDRNFDGYKWERQSWGIAMDKTITYELKEGYSTYDIMGTLEFKFTNHNTIEITNKSNYYYFDLSFEVFGGNNVEDFADFQKDLSVPNGSTPYRTGLIKPNSKWTKYDTFLSGFEVLWFWNIKLKKWKRK